MMNRSGSDVLEHSEWCHKHSDCILVCCNNLCRVVDRIQACNDEEDDSVEDHDDEVEGHGDKKGDEVSEDSEAVEAHSDAASAQS